MLEAWGRIVFRHRTTVLVTSGLFLAAMLFVLSRGTTLEVPHMTGTEADRAITATRREFPSTTGVPFTIVFAHPTWRADDPRFVAAARAVLDPLSHDPRVSDVRAPWSLPRPMAAPLFGTDGHHAAAVVTLAGSTTDALHAFPTMRPAIRSDALTVTLAGEPVFRADLQTTLTHDLKTGELIAMPFAFVVLLLVFGSLVAAMLPVGVGALAVAGGIAGVFILARSQSVTQFAINVTSLIGLGVAIDYSLFLVSRFRDALQRGSSTEEALVESLATAGRAVAFSGLAVAVGLGGLLFFRGSFLAAMGLAGTIVVLLAVLVSLTFLPALLAFLGPNVDRYRIALPFANRGRGRFWHRMATSVMAHPFRVLVPILALLIASGLPFLRLRLASADVTELPVTTEARRGDALLHAQFPQLADSVILALVSFPTEGALAPERTQALTEYVEHVRQIPNVSRVDSIVSLLESVTPEQRAMLFTTPSFYLPSSIRMAIARTVSPHAALVVVHTPYRSPTVEAHGVLEALRRERVVGDGTVLVGGATAMDADMTRAFAKNAPYAIGFVVLATLFVLFVLLRSVLLPIKAVLMNVLSISASFGALVWIFQDGHFHEALGFTPAPIEPALPFVLFCAVFGLSMDYEVLLLSRMQERFRQHGDNTRAVAEGLESSARLIGSAAAIMVAVFAAFIFAHVVVLKAMGMGMAIAVAVDATLVRLLLVPATMRLLGNWNWWAPRWMQHRGPVRHSHYSLPPATVPPAPRTV